MSKHVVSKTQNTMMVGMEGNDFVKGFVNYFHGEFLYYGFTLKGLDGVTITTATIFDWDDWCVLPYSHNT